MTLNIAVAGNCQAGIVANVIRHALRDVAGLDCRHIITDGEETANAFIENADHVVLQITDFHTRGNPAAEGSRRSGRPLRFPLIACNFLYPFAGKPHPCAAASRSTACPSGFYEGQLSDSVLLNLMNREPDAPAQHIVQLYLAQDYTRHTDLDRLFEINRMKMQRIGAHSGLDLWPKIERMFRDAPLFFTYLHPTSVLMRAVCRYVLEQLPLGLDQRSINDAVATVHEPFGSAHAPIHPSVVRHFGIDWAPPEYQYRMMPHGAFTAEEFALRFIRFEHDEALVNAVHNLHTGGDVQASTIALEAAQQRYPDNPDIMMHLALAHFWQGRLQPALEAAICAVERMPGDAEWSRLLCAVARQAALPQKLQKVA